MPDRRGFLLSTASAVAAAAVGMSAFRPRVAAAASPPLTKFVDALPLPGTLKSVGTMQRPGFASGPLYNVPVTEFTQKLHRDLPATKVWGYGGSYPGPTIAAQSGTTVYVRYLNNLPNAPHPLWSDAFACVHGPDMANPPSARRIVTHLHGGKVPADSDGWPEQTLLPGQQTNPVFVYPNIQEAATLWYHDHALGITRLNVMMGLAGYYLLSDTWEKQQKLPKNQFDVPLAIQDRMFNADGSLSYPTTLDPEFFGDVMLVNGKVWPYLDVLRGKYRFRLLNGCNSKFLVLALGNNATFWQVASEQGLLPAPKAMTSITLGPGERADIVVDFAPYAPGSVIQLTDAAPAAPFKGTESIGTPVPFMQFRVRGGTGATDPLPTKLRTVVRTSVDRSKQFDLVQALDPAQVKATRGFFLREATTGFACNTSADFTAVIVDEAGNMKWSQKAATVPLNQLERWVFVNETPDTHPIHLHLVQFQVESRTGGRVPNAEGLGVWKDTVQIDPGETVSLLAVFNGFKGNYPFHCHILEHEDHEMMRYFTVS